MTPYQLHEQYGQPVQSLEQLSKCTSIIHKNWGILPSSFVMSMQARCVLRAFKQMFVYDKGLGKLATTKRDRTKWN